MNCLHCKKEFVQKNKTNIYCSIKCRNLAGYFRNKKSKIIKPVKCITCNKEFIQKSKINVYCCKKCKSKASHIRDKNNPRVIKDRKCIVCNGDIINYRHDRCPVHQKEYVDTLYNHYKFKTISEYKNTDALKGKHPSWFNVQIRQFARSWFKHLTKLPCARCGYNKHVELCHIKSVTSFPDTALLGEINSADNIIQLCPNCHWEFDNKDKIDDNINVEEFII